MIIFKHLRDLYLIYKIIIPPFFNRLLDSSRTNANEWESFPVSDLPYFSRTHVLEPLLDFWREATAAFVLAGRDDYAMVLADPCIVLPKVIFKGYRRLWSIKNLSCHNIAIFGMNNNDMEPSISTITCVCSHLYRNVIYYNLSWICAVVTTWLSLDHQSPRFTLNFFRKINLNSLKVLQYF